MKIERGYPRATITKKGEASLSSGHSWVYEAEVLSLSEQPENGSLVDVVSEKGKYLGTGLYSQFSKIRIRLISRNANDKFDEAFLAQAAFPCLGIPKDSDAGRYLLLPRDFRRGRPLPRPHGRPVFRRSRRSNAICRNGETKAPALPNVV